MDDINQNAGLAEDPYTEMPRSRAFNEVMFPEKAEPTEPPHFGSVSRFLHNVIGYTPHKDHTSTETKLRNGVACLAFVSLGYVAAASYYYATTFIDSHIVSAAIAAATLGGFFFIDRGFAQAEDKAHIRNAAQNLYHKHMGLALSIGEKIQETAMDALKKGSRLAIAVCFSFLVGEAIGQKIFENEINSVITERYQTANAELIQTFDGRVKAYDTETGNLQEELVTLRQELLDLEAQANDVASGRVSIQSTDVGRETLARLTTIRQRITAKENETDKLTNEVSEQNAIMQAELRGAGREGTSGIAGRGPRFDAAQIERDRLQALLNRASNELSDLREDESEIETEIRGLEATAREDLGRLKESLPTQLVTARDRVTEKSRQIENRINRRDGIVTGYERDMQRDPDYVKRQSGAVERHSALNQFIEETPGAGLRVNLFKALFFFVELSVFLAAMSLRPARADVRDELGAINAENEHAARVAMQAKTLNQMLQGIGVEIPEQTPSNQNTQPASEAPAAVPTLKR